MRRDIRVYNEATGFSLHARSLGGRSRAEVARDLPGAVRAGQIIPIKLVQDDSLSVRVVIGDLKPQEEAEWVGRFAWKLSVPCGSLAIEGGFDPRTTDDDDFVSFVKIPKGDWLVEVFTLFSGVNGEYCVSATGDREPLGVWFRRTRPGKAFPLWLKRILVEEPELDPGHEPEWETLEDEEDLWDDDDEPNHLDFIIRLAPLDESRLEPVFDQHGWFPIAPNPRKPDLFPLGIRSRK